MLDIAIINKLNFDFRMEDKPTKMLLLVIMVVYKRFVC